MVLNPMVPVSANDLVDQDRPSIWAISVDTNHSIVLGTPKSIRYNRYIPVLANIWNHSTNLWVKVSNYF